MRSWDLLEYRGQRWVAQSHNRDARVMIIYGESGTKVEVSDSLEEDEQDCKVIANLAKDWLVLLGPVRKGAGPFSNLSIPASMSEPVRPLRMWFDWLPNDFIRDGGSIYLNPQVGARPGSIILATHRKGSVSRIVVPAVVGSVSQHVTKARAPVRPVEQRPVTRFNRILQNRLERDREDDDD